MIEQLLKQITDEYSVIFYIRQVVAILVLFVYGYLTCRLLCMMSKIRHNKENEEQRGCLNPVFYVFLAFPVGIAVFGLCGITILISGIRYCRLSVVLLMAVVLAVIVINSVKISVGEDPALKSLFKYIAGEVNITSAVVCISAVIAIILVSVSGFISLGFTNDSMYFYSEYPRAIVNLGCLNFGFDANLTDAGQTTAVINTLPYLFGFDETFGIHTFFNINFIMFFAYAIYEQAGKRFEKKKSLAFAVLFTLLLITSMPFVLISKWNIANVYFMEQMFICMYMYFKMHEEKIELTAVMTILLMMLSFMRIEGSLYAALVLLFAVAVAYGKSDSVSLHNSVSRVGLSKSSIIIPAVFTMILQCAYFAKIFIFMELYATYTFMTKEKVLVIPVIFIFIIIYVYKFADKLKIEYNITYIAGLVFANIAVFIYDRAGYIENVRSLVLNLRGNSGWGIFPAVAAALIILVPKVRIKTLYFDTFFICFALLSLIACAMRDSTLRVSFADSGNRVFMQIVPFVIYAFAYRFINAMHVLSSKDK